MNSNRIVLSVVALYMLGCGSSQQNDNDPCASYADYTGPGWHCMGGAEPLTDCTMDVYYNEIGRECALKCLFTPCFVTQILSTTVVDGETVAFTCDNGYPDAPIVCYR